ncbi:MAG TPA: polysaccharide biosynthesis/export family protein [Aestuariivirga sp.]|nr:polysaccharide biosynthesis/export family protein [Aestuariivirga sp.]
MMLAYEWKRRWAVMLAVLAGLVLAGCTGNSSLGGAGLEANGQFAQTGGGAAKGSAAAAANQIFASNAVADTASEDYRIAGLDVIDVSVLGVPDLSRTVQVSSSGNITLPLIRQIKAGGRTAAQLERDIAGKLQASYLQSPQVSVFVKEFNSQRITVDGAVQKPGIYPITGKTSLLQAIALAQGLNDVADPSGVIVFRAVNNKRMAARFDIRKVRSGQITDPALQAGDIVMVDESSGRTTLRDVKNFLPLTGLFSLLL